MNKCYETNVDIFMSYLNKVNTNKAWTTKPVHTAV